MSVTRFRKVSNGKNSSGYMVGIPAGLGRAIESAGYSVFEIKPTDDGILLVPLKVDEQPQVEEMPAWLSPNNKQN